MLKGSRQHNACAALRHSPTRCTATAPAQVHPLHRSTPCTLVAYAQPRPAHNRRLCTTPPPARSCSLHGPAHGTARRARVVQQTCTCPLNPASSRSSRFEPQKQERTGLSSRGKKKKTRLRNANRNVRSRGCSLLHGHRTFSTSKVGGWRLVAVGGWRRLAAVGGGWRLVAVGGWRLAVGSWQLVVGAVLKGCP